LRVTVVIPTLTAGEKLVRCLSSLEAQTWRDFETVIVDNGDVFPELSEARVIRPGENLGFSKAIEAALQTSHADYVLTLNDDTTLEPDCLERLVQAIESDPRRGACAPQIVLSQTRLLDSAGMSVARDGSSRQRGHLDSPAQHGEPADVLFPSGCAALYRRSAMEEAGGFDPDFFLYCEDTDLGLRLQRLGWSCRYEPAAIVYHDYSQTAGPASARKVYFVERNRLAVLVKNFPLDWILVAPVYSAYRYILHIRALASGRGYAGQGSASVAWPEYAAAVVRATWHWLLWLPRLLRSRRQLHRRAKLSPREYRALLRRHILRISEVAGV
jgi:GT2 family glycosyltransferase